MELILKETINTLGQEGDVVTVKPGYGRNYLLPQGKAVTADPENLAILARNRATIETRIEHQRQEAELLSKKLAGVTLEIQQLAGEDERLFGSVTTSDICEKLASLNISVDKKMILLAEPIKTLGETSIPVKVGFNLTTNIMVRVTNRSSGE
jgi:large subunit ribosomal protein L9